MRTCAILLGILLVAATATAQEGAPPRRPSDTPPPPSCLDRTITDELGQDLRPRGVQKKTFLKRRRVELVGHGGLFASDLMSSSYAYGGALAFYPYEDFGLELRVDRTPVALDVDTPIAEFFGDPRFPRETALLGLASALWSPIHFKLRTSGGSIVHGDGIFALGGGRLFADSAQGLAFAGGFLLELYPARWLSLRLDLRDLAVVQEAVGETRYTHNLVALLGIGLWVPFGF